MFRTLLRTVATEPATDPARLPGTPPTSTRDRSSTESVTDGGPRAADTAVQSGRWYWMLSIEACR